MKDSIILISGVRPSLLNRINEPMLIPGGPVPQVVKRPNERDPEDWVRLRAAQAKRHRKAERVRNREAQKLAPSLIIPPSIRELARMAAEEE